MAPRRGGAQARAHGDVDVGEVHALGGAGLGLHLLVALEAGAVLGLARLGAGAHPLELGLHLLGAARVLLALGLEARGLLLEVGGVVALVGVELASVDLADPLGHIIEEVAVVRDRHDGAGVAVQELLEPEHRLGVEVVGGLVEQQQVGGLEQQAAQGDAATLAAGEDGDGRVGVGALKRVHRLRELGVEVPAVGGVDLVLELSHLGHEGVEVRVGVGHLGAHLVEALDLGEQVGKGLLDVLANGLVLVERRLLLQDAHGVARGEHGLAVGDVLEAGHDLEQRRLAGTVGTHHADLGARVDAHRDVVEDDLVVDGLAGADQLVHELCHGVFAFPEQGFVELPLGAPHPGRRVSAAAGPLRPRRVVPRLNHTVNRLPCDRGGRHAPLCHHFSLLGGTGAGVTVSRGHESDSNWGDGARRGGASKSPLRSHPHLGQSGTPHPASRPDGHTAAASTTPWLPWAPGPRRYSSYVSSPSMRFQSSNLRLSARFRIS